jgi:uncharacterized protein
MVQSTTKPKKVRVAAVGDLHVHKVHHGELRPLFAEISDAADVLVLAGDLTNLGLEEEARHLADDLATLRIPAVGVLGNHDHHSGRTEEIKKILSGAGLTFLEDETFEFGGVGFAGTKGFGGGFGSHLLGSFGEEATKRYVAEAVNESLRLETSLQSLSTSKRIAVLHYAPIAETVVGEPDVIAPYLGCSRLAETIDRFEIAAVFHGHAHHGAAHGKTQRGIPVHNCSIHVLRRETQRLFMVIDV